MNSLPPASNISRDQALRDRAALTIPGGMWGHQRVEVLPKGYPQFYASGSGARLGAGC